MASRHDPRSIGQPQIFATGCYDAAMIGSRSTSRRRSAVALTLACCLFASACASSGDATKAPPERAGEPAATPAATPQPAAQQPAPASSIDADALVAAEDRSEEDRKADERRAPAELLRFCELAPGMRVADIGAGTGYTTELLARAVGPEGVVYGQNTEFIIERFAKQGWAERLAKPVNAAVVSVVRDFSDPLPPELEGQLDRVVNVLFYHDFEWQGIDRAAHNKAVLRALKPGGYYVIIDASAREGDGATQSKTLHRVEEALVREELQAAGFELAGESDFLRNPADTRDWNALPWRGEGDGQYSDKFALKFRKPG